MDDISLEAFKRFWKSVMDHLNDIALKDKDKAIKIIDHALPELVRNNQYVSPKQAEYYTNMLMLMKEDLEKTGLISTDPDYYMKILDPSASDNFEKSFDKKLN